MFRANHAIRSKKYLSLVTYLSFLLSGIGAFYAAITHRPLLHDGAAWYFLLFTRGSARDLQYTRYFTLVLEWPATFLFKFFSDVDIKVIIAALDFPFAFHSLFSLFICYLILKKKNRLDLMVFPILSYATATISTFAFAVGIVPESLSLFWPLFLLLFFRDNSQWKENVWCVVLMIALMVTYEMAALFFGVLFILQALRFKNTRELSDKIFLALTVFGMAFCIYRVIGPTAGTSEYFWLSIKKPLDLFRIYILLMISGFFLLILSQLKFPRTLLPTIIFVICAVVSGFFLHIFSTYNSGAVNAYFSRVTAIPIAAFIALCFLLLTYKVKDSKKIEKLLTGLPLLLVSLLMIVSNFYDIRFTNFWDTSNKKFLENHKDFKGCVRMSEPYGIRMGWAVPFLSVMLQEKRKIDWITFGLKNVEKSCSDFAEGYINDGSTDHRVDNHRYFDFSTALEEARKTENLPK